jgi:predicted HTH transcriptional regulator
MAANGSPPPEFDTDDERTYFLIRLPIHPRATAGAAPAITEKTRPKTSVETSVKTTARTPTRILELLKAHPTLTLAEVAKDIGLTTRAAELAAAKLVKVGHLRYVGTQKGGHWKVLPPQVRPFKQLIVR